ncbi:condesin subunit E, partial [Salmonella enterica subsp. enterica serovar Infantis]
MSLTNIEQVMPVK